MVEIDYRVARLRRILIIVILATLPLYLLGTIILLVANTASAKLTVTPTNNILFITATPAPTRTNEPPTLYPSATPTHTATITATFTITPTSTLTPTLAPSFTPSPSSTPTLEPTLELPTLVVPPSETPVVNPTEITPTIPTEVPTDISIQATVIP